MLEWLFLIRNLSVGFRTQPRFLRRIDLLRSSQGHIGRPARWAKRVGPLVYLLSKACWREWLL